MVRRRASRRACGGRGGGEVKLWVRVADAKQRRGAAIAEDDPPEDPSANSCSARARQQAQ